MKTTARTTGRQETGFDRIHRDAQAFYEIVDRCAAAMTYNAADFKDAYNRLSRLRDRYVHEVEHRTLTQIQHVALRKVFEEDGFIKSILADGRQIGEHVQKKSGGPPSSREGTLSRSCRATARGRETCKSSDATRVD